MSRDMSIPLVFSSLAPAPPRRRTRRGAPGTPARPQPFSTSMGTRPATTRGWRRAFLHHQLPPSSTINFLQLPLPPTINFLFLHHQLPPSPTINFLHLQLPPTSIINFLHHHGLGLPCRRPQGFGLRPQLHHHSLRPQLQPQLHHHRGGVGDPCLARPLRAGLQPSLQAGLGAGLLPRGIPGEGGLQATRGWNLTSLRGRRRWTLSSPR